MLTITGKSVITTDWHFGLKTNSENRLRILLTVTKEISMYMKDNNVDNFIFTGDLFHSRSTLSVGIINIAIKCMDKISKSCKNVYLILGNHDIFNRNTVEVNSVNIFKHMKNVHIIDKSTECEINGKKCLFVPWLGDMTQYGNNTFDMIFGHFDISHQYMINSFIEDNITKNTTCEEMKKLLEHDELLRESGLEDLDSIEENTEDSFFHREKSSNLVGDWIGIVKRGGTIFAGHIHRHREFYSKARKFIFIGSPYQTTRSEMNSQSGFYVLNENGKYEFKEITGTPKFIEIRISDVLKDIDNFDYSIVKGNIIHRIYDAEIDRLTEAKINQRIYDRDPFEEITPEYAVTYNNDGTVSESVEAIKKSKLEYLQLYIDNIDKKVFEEKSLKKDVLMKKMTEYYHMVAK